MKRIAITIVLALALTAALAATGEASPRQVNAGSQLSVALPGPRWAEYDPWMWPRLERQQAASLQTSPPLWADYDPWMWHLLERQQAGRKPVV